MYLLESEYLKYNNWILDVTQLDFFPLKTRFKTLEGILKEENATKV